MTESAPRDRTVSVRLDAVEAYHLDQLVDVYGLPQSAVLRHLILSAPLYRVRVDEPPAPLVLRRRTPEERAAYLAAKRAEWVAAGRDVDLLDVVIESLGGVPE